MEEDGPTSEPKPSPILNKIKNNMRKRNEIIYIDDDDSPQKDQETSSCYFNKPEKNAHIRSLTMDSPEKVIPDPPILKTDEPPKSADVRIISGVKVEFPVKPYGAQIALMDKVIKGITKGQNCLLESPTGSGKTLALLCSALAWQKQRREGILNRAKDIYKALHTSPTNPSIESPQKKVKANPIFNISFDSDDDGVFKNFPSSKKKLETTPDDKGQDQEDYSVKIHKRQRMSPSMLDNITNVNTPQKSSIQDEKLSQNEPTDDDEENIDFRIPKIFFGTRTHKQLTQVIRELKKTVYKDGLKMSILSSREQSCARDLIPKYKSKLEMCRDLLDKKHRARIESSSGKNEYGCSFFNNKALLLGSKAPRYVWDIEEIVDIGKKRGACPYFAARDLALTADIVFCPYNYLLDPLIRSSISLDTTNDILLIDEAHNIEEVCRDAASLTIELNTINDAILDIDGLIKGWSGAVCHDIPNLRGLMDTLIIWREWFENHTPLIKKQQNFESSYSLSGSELVESLVRHKIGFKEFPAFLSRIQNILEDLKENSINSGNMPKLSVASSTAVLLESMAIVFGYIYQNDCKNVENYVGLLVKKEEWKPTQQNSQGWLTKKSRNEVASFSLSLNIKCLAPSVVFDSINKTSRCVILTSGTLTPIFSFPAELGCEFPITLQTNHVISPNQVWVGSVNCGPDNTLMEATYQNTSQTKWQDALGKLLLWICKNVPHGVLCFLPSYRLMEILCDRWRITGTWREIEDVKSIFTESKRMKEHDEVMTDYYSCVDDNQGALLLAIFRGKVSEGMDFKDQQARAVVSVGIPYPNVKDSMINSKMKYNESYKINKGLLSGRDWLQVQAFRALNQALGRCVRHRNDWGAVIMVDSRFQYPSYTKHISKWVRNFLANNHHSWDSLTGGPNNLKLFMDKMMLESQPGPSAS